MTHASGMTSSLTAPVEMPPPPSMTSDYWREYCRSVWVARLDAHLQCRYYARAGWWLGALRFMLDIVVTGSSLVAVSSLLTSAPQTIATTASVVVALCTVLQMVGKLDTRIERAHTLVERWEERCVFWDEAFLMLANSSYLGTIASMRAAEAPLRKLETELGVPDVAWIKRRLMDEIERSDTYASQQKAAA